ncbi:MAG: ATP-binding protein [bacterium]|nr:ATP-binding protein [bacterium]
MDIYSFLYALPSLVATIANLFLAIFVYHRNKRARVNQVFAILSLCLASWNFGVFSWYLPLQEHVIDLLSRIFRTGLLFVPPTSLHFCLILSGNLEKKSNQHGLLIAYILAAWFSFFNWTPYLVTGLKQTPWGYSPVAGWGYYLFIVNFLFFIIWGLFVLYRKYQTTTSPLLANRIRYLFAGSLMAVLLGSINFLSILGIKIYPIGNMANVFYTGIVAYAICKYHLLDIEVIIEKGIVYATLTLFISGIYGIIVGLTQWLFSATFAFTSLLGNVLAAMIIAISFHPLRALADKLVDSLFFRKDYEPAKVLKDFSIVLNSTIGLDNILKVTLETILDKLSIDSGLIMLYDKDKIFRVRVSRGMEREAIDKISFSADDYLIRQSSRSSGIYFREEANSVIRDAQINGEKIRISDKKLEELGCSKAIPLLRNDELMGIIILGNKLSGDIFTYQDIETLETLASEADIAIENALLYEKIMDMQHDIYQADKLSTLGTMASELVHEIKNPLTSISTFVQLIAYDFENKEFQEKFSKIVPKEIDRLSNILQRFSESAKVSEPVFSVVDISDIIEDILLLKSGDFSRIGVNIDREYNGNILEIHGDEGQLKQVFMNLVINALESMPNGGNLSVSVQVDDKWLKVSIKDTGYGIPEEKLPNIFKSFFTTKATGTGLGLAISARIIKAHYGEITVESIEAQRDKGAEAEASEGQGTTFIVKLPLKIDSSRIVDMSQYATP